MLPVKHITDPKHIVLFSLSILEKSSSDEGKARTCINPYIASSEGMFASVQ